MVNVVSENLVLGRLGELVVKIAETPQEISAALQLRHKVFFDGRTDPELFGLDQKDEDRFDVFCDHLIVVEGSSSPSDAPKVIATYRLMGQAQAEEAGAFYSSSEFDIDTLTARHQGLRFLELGRSCVLPEYRTKRTIELLWHGSWAYVRKHKFDVMFGCASLNGISVEAHREALSFLFKTAKAEQDWDIRGKGEVIQLQSLHSPKANPKSAIRALPPLIKGYLRLGAMFASDAVIDRNFGTIDVLVLLPVSRINPRYVNYYGENAERHS